MGYGEELIKCDKTGEKIIEKGECLMKSIKKMLSMLLVAVFILVMPMVSFAEDSINLNDSMSIDKRPTPYTLEGLNNELKQIGFPENIISEMPLEDKQHIIGKNPVGLFSIETQEFSIDENGEMKEIKANKGEYGPFATIPTTDLKMTTSVVDLGRISGRQTYTLYYQWDWKKTTSFAWTDRVALSYNDEFQTRISNNGDYYCRSSAYREGSTLPPTSTNCGGRTADATFGGASWNYDMKLGDLNSGVVSMDIETKALNKSGNLITLAKYYHKKGVPGSLGLSIGYATISVISGSNYDEAASQGSKAYK